MKSLTNQKLASPTLNKMKQDLIDFQQSHSKEKLLQEKQLQERFPKESPSIQAVTGIITHQESIPKIDIMLEQAQIGNNAPASGIRIFEQHMGLSRSYHSNSGGLTPLSPGQKSEHENSGGSIHY